MIRANAGQPDDIAANVAEPSDGGHGGDVMTEPTDPALEPSDEERAKKEAAERAGRRWALGCLLVPVLFFGGCAVLLAVGDTDGDDADPADGSSSADVVAMSDEDRFVATVRSVANVSDVSDAALVYAGREACGALDRGVSFAEVAIMSVAEAGQTGGVIIGAAVPAFCPQHQAALDDYLEQVDNLGN